MIIGLALGGIVAAAGFLGWQATQNAEPEEPVEQPEPTPPPVERNPFAAMDSMNATISAGVVETEFKSLKALQVWRELSTDAAWALAVDSAAKAYPILARFRELEEADTNYDRWDWLEPGQEALALFVKADEYGLRVETGMRDSREFGYKFESIREARAEWVRFRRELERKVGTLEDPILPPGAGDE